MHGGVEARWSSPSRSSGALPLLAVVVLIVCAGCRSPEQVSLPEVFQPAPLIAELKKSAAGWNAGDLDAFIAIYAENATFARPDSFLRGKAAIRALYAPVFAPGVERDSLVLEHVDVDPISNDVVLVKGIYHNAHQGVVSRRGTTTLLMRFINGKWLIVHDHSS